MRLSRLALLLIAVFIVISGFFPWRLPYNPDARYSDALTSHYPAALHLYNVVWHDESLLWRDTLMADQPFAANPLNKVAYPPQMLILITGHVGIEFHLTLLIIAHLTLAAFGMLLFARALGIRDEAAALAMLAYGLAPRVIGHLGAGHLDLVYALAWLPWLLWAIHRFSAGWRVRWTLVVGLCAGMLFLADVRLALFGLILAAAYALKRIVETRQFARGWFAAAIITLLLAMGVLLPLIAWQPHLTRAALTPADANIFPIAPLDLVGLFITPQGNIETLTSVGVIALLLGIVGVFARRVWFWGLALVVAAWYAFGADGGLWNLLTSIFSPLLWFRVPSRAWLIVALIVPLLAGFGFDALLTWLETSRYRRRIDRAAFAVMALGIVAGIALLLTPLPDMVGVGWIAVGLFGLVLLLAVRRRITLRQFALLALIVVFAELSAAGRLWLEWRPLPEAPEFVQTLLDEDAYRVYSPTYSLEQDAAARNGLRLFGGVDPFQIAAVSEAIQAGGGITDSGYSVVQPPLETVDPAEANRDAPIDTAVLGEWGVTHVVSAYSVENPMLELIATIGDPPTYIYANRDPALTTTFSTHPHWADWAGLPDPAAVERANLLTIIGLIVTYSTFTIVSALIIITAYRKATPA